MLRKQHTNIQKVAEIPRAALARMAQAPHSYGGRVDEKERGRGGESTSFTAHSPRFQLAAESSLLLWRHGLLVLQPYALGHF